MYELDEELSSVCRECSKRVPCEIAKIELHIGWMEVLGRHSLSSEGKMVPLMGLGEYAVKYEHLKQRLEELRRT
jgi:hypothetical protein